MFKILCVDDEVSVTKALARVFRGDDFSVQTFNRAQDALQFLQTDSEHIDLVISDMRMPEMDGAEFLKQVYENFPHIQRVLLTGYSDQESAVKAVNEGHIHKYVNKPWDNLELKQLVIDLCSETQQRQALEDFTQSKLESYSDQIAEAEKELDQTTSMLSMAKGDLNKNLRATLQVMANLISERVGDRDVSAKVVKLTGQFGKSLNLNQKHQNSLVFAALLYSLGKLALPDELLKRPLAELDAHELLAYKKHGTIAFNALTPLTHLQYAAKLVLHQNEHYDGSGYPEKLFGDGIPLGARILKIVIDYVQYLMGVISGQPLSKKDTLAKMDADVKTIYDPELYNHFCKHLVKVDDVDHEDHEVSIGDLKAGMVIARGIFNQEKVLLVAEGTELNDDLVSRLRVLARNNEIDGHGFIESGFEEARVEEHKQ